MTLYSSATSDILIQFASPLLENDLQGLIEQFGFTSVTDLTGVFHLRTFRSGQNIMFFTIHKWIFEKINLGTQQVREKLCPLYDHYLLCVYLCWQRALRFGH